mmetsp:Transcript_11044/g.19972  ORF Transcript_11044/g.19972 Transcript_11044/m.19972 type:complete len:84 (+) Transcript_11044:1384-1635(+)
MIQIKAFDWHIEILLTVSDWITFCFIVNDWLTFSWRTLIGEREKWTLDQSFELKQGPWSNTGRTTGSHELPPMRKGRVDVDWL